MMHALARFSGLSWCQKKPAKAGSGATGSHQPPAIPRTSPEDPVHIAVAAVHGMDLIVTWNFKHINNPILKHRMRSTLVLAGYVLPEIFSPDELAEASDD